MSFQLVLFCASLALAHHLYLILLLLVVKIILLLLFGDNHKLFVIQKIRRRKTASWLRERVLQLGPTFIKLGQLSSTRSDLFPKEFVEELAKLQVFSVS